MINYSVRIIKLSRLLFSLLSPIMIVVFLSSCQPENRHADMIIENANIWTGDEKQPHAEAMAILGDTILAVGSYGEIQIFKGADTKTLDLDGKFVTPGFIDSHVHLFEGGFNLSSVQLRDAVSPEEFTQRIGAFAKTVPKGTWIIGGAWDGSSWETLPSKEWIDELTPDHPVFVTRLDGHMSLANSLALDLAGIDNSVEEVEGGIIGRNAKNELTGIFKDNATMLITSKIAQHSDEQFDQALDNAMAYFVSNGVTSVHNVWYPSEPKGVPETIQRAYNDKRLIARVFDLGALPDWEKRASEVKKIGGDKWLKRDGLKGVLDGALGSHSAAFLEPFTDAPDDKGLFMMKEEDLYDWVLNADAGDLQIAIHAIGDRAIKVLLDNFEKIAEKNGAKDRRFRVEHAQHIDPVDFKRFGEMNVIPSVQPYHAIDDGRWAEKVIGPERIKTTYAFKSLFDAGAKVAFGSDWPVAPASPILGIYAAVTRRTLDDANPDGWVPEQKVSVEQALTAYTINGAYASFEEDIKGKLQVGMLADFVVINEDLTKTDLVKIKDLKVLQTYVGGKKVFDLEEE